MIFRSLITIALMATSTGAFCQQKGNDPLPVSDSASISPLGFSTGFGASWILAQSTTHIGLGGEIAFHIYSYRLHVEPMWASSYFEQPYLDSYSEISAFSVELGRAFFNGDMAIIPYAGWQWFEKVDVSTDPFDSSEEIQHSHGPTLGLDFDFFVRSASGLRIGLKGSFGSISCYSLGIQLRIGKGRYEKR